MFNILSLDL